MSVRLLMATLLLLGCNKQKKAESYNRYDQDGKKGDFELTDTMVILVGFEGNATLELDIGKEAYVGTETLYVFQSDGTSLLSGQPYTKSDSARLLCEYTHTTQASKYASRVRDPCQDPDGNFCDWQFDIDFGEGVESGGDYCADIFDEPQEPFKDIYGFLSDFQRGGYSYGPTMMVYYTGTTDGTRYQGWYTGTGGGIPTLGERFIEWDQRDKTLWYDWPVDYFLFYAL